jgi:hypothetical protein
MNAQADAHAEAPALTLNELSLHDRREMVMMAAGFHELQIVSYGDQIKRDQTQTLYICPICYCLPRAPALGSPSSHCPHTFCARCLALLIRHSNRLTDRHLETRFGVGVNAFVKCPLCQVNKISASKIHRWINWQPRLKSDWEKIQVRCVWPECGKVGGAMSIVQHEVFCAHRANVMRPANVAVADGEPAQKKQALERQ